jgi:PAS domain S-box-containing protein
MSLPDDGASRSTQSANAADVKRNSLATLLEQRDALQSIRISDELLEIIFQSIPNGITLYDHHGTLLFANKIGAYFYGYSTPEELLAVRDVAQIRRRFQERFAIEDEQGLPFTADMSPIERVLHGADAAEETFHCFDRATQREFWALSHANAVRDEHHQLVIVIGSITDVTDQKQAETALRKSEERLRFMAESMPQKIFTARPNGDVDYFNQQWMEFTGLSFEQIRDWGWTQFIHPEDVEENVRRWQHSLDTGEPFQFEHRFRRADGVYRWHLSRALPMRDEHGSIKMWIGSNTDIHEQKMAVVMRDDFVSMASHELKTPLTSLKGFNHVLRRHYIRQDDAEAASYLTKIEKQVDKLTFLITDLLDLSQIQRGELAYRNEVFDLHALAQEVVENVQRTTTTHHIQLQGQARLLVSGDRDRIEQVLMNLLSNAIKYSPKAKEVLVRVSRNDNEAQVAVQDFGIGIDAAYQQHLFERFYRVTEPSAQTYPGLGIGLYISNEIIRRHGGRLWMESEKGKGSTFTFSLPLASLAPKEA